MEIPEVTEDQVKLMLAVCANPDMSVFSQTSPQDNDPLAFKVMLGRAEEAVQHLISLKFLKEITEEHKEQIDKTNEESGRKWRVYEITALGRAMFQAYTSPLVN